MHYKAVCEICGQGPGTNGTALYRTGKKGPGENPHWRCSVHKTDEVVVDPLVAEVTGLIESDGSTKH